MTASRSHRIDDLLGIRMSGRSSDFPDLETEQTVPLGALDRAAFNHEVELVADRQNEQSENAIVCGVSGWFSPDGVRYDQDVRPVSQIEPAEWSALLDHADAIDFFDRPEPAPAGPSHRIFHLTITAGDRHRELAINNPFETAGLARLIALTRRAVRDREVLSPEMLDDVQFAALATAWRTRKRPIMTRIRAADEQDEGMTDDRRAGLPEMPLRQAGEPPRGPLANILDALDVGVSARSISRSNDRPAIRVPPRSTDRSTDTVTRRSGTARIFRADMIRWPAVTPAAGPLEARNDAEVIKSANDLITIGKGEEHTPRYG